MIFEIRGIDITKINLETSHVITISNDGSSVLVFSNTTQMSENITVIASIQEEELDSLLQQPFWKQPCINC